MKRQLTTILLTIIAVTAMAIPAKRGVWKMITLSDGTEVRAQLVGDEHGHYWLSEDGIAYNQANNKDYYVQVDAQKIMAKAKVRRAAANAKRVKKRQFGHPTTILGKKKAIMILANYKDQSFQRGHNNGLYQKIANQENYNEGNFQGSMADYFKAQSRGKFELDFDVVGPVTVSKNASYYGNNVAVGNEDVDEHAAEMVIEAVNLAKEQITDWTPYDWDEDGYVDQVYVVYAGMGEADGGDDVTIWPHASDLASAKDYYHDGTGPVQVGTNLYVDSYACGGELNGQTGDIAGIGTMCHEYSHCLGYPDFYDIDYSGGQGMCEWDLMDGGSYNGDGYQPAGYTSYERWFAGWETPITLEDEDVTVENMKSLQSGGESYIIYNKGNRNEYFLLENRQLDGWDASLNAAGLLILHVDYDEGIWEANKPNDIPSHQRMTWIPAGKKYQYVTENSTKYYYTTEQDIFPYRNVNAFNKDFGTLAKLYNKNSDKTYYLSSSVEDITQNDDGTISFNFVAPSSGGGETSGSDVFEKVTSGSQIVIGNEYVLVCEDNEVGSGVFTDKYLASVDVTISENTASGDGLSAFTLGGSSSGYSLKLADGNYLTTAAAKSLKTTGTESKVWTISSTSDGYVVKSLTDSYGTILYYASYPRFCNYTSTQKPAVLYVKSSTPTGIKGISITERPADNRIYSIDGRYVGNDLNILRPGIYIVGGRKVVR